MAAYNKQVITKTKQVNDAPGQVIAYVWPYHTYYLNGVSSVLARLMKKQVGKDEKNADHAHTLERCSEKTGGFKAITVGLPPTTNKSSRKPNG